MIGNLLEQLRTAHIEILGDNLAGLYVHGSIAFGCFNEKTSDVDFLSVVREPITDEQARALCAVLYALSAKAPEKGLEMSVVLLDMTQHPIHPAPFELHFSNMYKDHEFDSLIHHPRLCDPDLAAHFAVTRTAGFSLHGLSVREAFAPVPKAMYIEAIMADVGAANEDICANPTYITLNLCRALAYAQDELILSKKAGGEWALENLPPRLHFPIEAALQAYTGGEAIDVGADALMDYAEAMLSRLESCRGGL